MPDGKPISIRLSPWHDAELDRRIATGHTTRGLHVKRLLESALDGSIGEANRAEPIDAAKLAASLLPHLAGRQGADPSSNKEVLELLAELVSAVNELRADLRGQRRDLRILADLLEGDSKAEPETDPSPDQGLPRNTDVIPLPPDQDDGDGKPFLHFDDK